MINPKNKNCGRQTGNAYFLVASLDSNAIPTAMGMFFKVQQSNETSGNTV